MCVLPHPAAHAAHAHAAHAHPAAHTERHFCSGFGPRGATKEAAKVPASGATRRGRRGLWRAAPARPTQAAPFTGPRFVYTPVGRWCVRGSVCYTWYVCGTVALPRAPSLQVLQGRGCRLSISHQRLHTTSHRSPDGSRSVWIADPGGSNRSGSVAGLPGSTRVRRRSSGLRRPAALLSRIPVPVPSGRGASQGHPCGIAGRETSYARTGTRTPRGQMCT